MVAPSIKVPNVTNVDESGLVPTPGTLEFNTDLDAMRYFNNAGIPQTVSTGSGGGTGTQNIVWVGVNGSDVTGDGTFNNPYASLTNAMAQITTASSTNQFVIQMGGGTYNENTVSLKPFVYIEGNNALLILFGFLQLDASFDSTPNAFSLVRDLAIEAEGAVQLQCNVFQNASVHFENCDFTGTAQITLVGAGTDTGAELFIIEKSINFGAFTPILTQNCSVGYINNNTTGIFFTNTSATTNCFLYYQSNFGNTSNSVLDIQNSSTGTITSYITGNPMGGGLTIDGTGITVNIDSTSYSGIPGFATGATISQVNLLSETDGVNQTSFTPVSYTPVGSSNYSSTSLTANLAGIDAALASVAPGTPIAQQLYVNFTNGNDSHAGTNISTALKTYEAARALAAASANSSNRYLIIVIGDQTIAADFTISPFINVIQYSGTMTVSAGNVVLDSTWSAQTGESVTIQCNFAGSGGVNLAYTAGQNNIVIFKDCNMTGLLATPAFQVSSPNTTATGQYNGVHIVDSPFPMFNSGCTITDSVLTLTNCTLMSSLTVNSTGTGGAYFNSQSSFILGNVTFDSHLASGSGSLLVVAIGSFFELQIVISGSLTQFQCDVSSYNGAPVLNLGATTSQLILASSSDGLLVNNFSPNNYPVPSDPSRPDNCITDHLAGIDSRLALLASPIAQNLWVNNNSGDDTFSGDISAPLASYGAALAIAASFASAGNQYVINIIGDQNITGDFVVGPNVTVDGHDSGIITATGNLIIDPSVISSSNLLATVKNCSFNLNSIALTFGSGHNNIVLLLNCTFPSVPSITVTSPNTNTNPSGLVIYGRPEALTTYFAGGVTITDAQASFTNISMITNITVSATGTISPTSVVLENVNGSNTITASSPLGAICDIDLINSASQNVTLSDPNCSVFTDVLSLDSHNLTLSGGATVSQVTYETDCTAQGVTSLLYVPTNYTATSPSPKVRSDSILSHLNGINTALAGVIWTEVVLTSQSMSPNHGYVANNASLVTLTLPTTCAFGTVIYIDGKGSGGWKIAQNSGQTIYYQSSTTTTGAMGHLDSTNSRACVTLRCITANNEWVVETTTGAITLV